MKEIRLNFPSRSIIKYTWGEIKLIELLLNLKPFRYYSHYTALKFNQLLESDSNLITLNYERPKKELSEYEILQENIYRVFKGKSRVTKSITSYKDEITCMVNENIQINSE